MRQGIVIFLCCISLALTACSKEKSQPLQGFIKGEFTIVSPFSAGFLKKVFVDDGDQVKQGQVLYILDPYPEIAQLKQAQGNLNAAQQTLQDLERGGRSTVLAAIEAQLKAAQANFRLAQAMLSRDRKLYRKRVIGRAKLDETIATYKSNQEQVVKLQSDLAEAKLGARTNKVKAQQATVEALQASVERLQWLLEQKTVRAPINGVVQQTPFHRGEYIAPGAAVVALLDYRRSKVIFYVPEPLLSRIKLGQTIEFGCDGCRKRGRAVIAFISTRAEYTPPVIFSRSAREKLVFEVEADLPDKDGSLYHPGQPVDVYLGLAK